MPIRKEEKVDALSHAISQIMVDNPVMNPKKVEKEIVDIITFCDDPRFLDLLSHKFNLYLPQRIILKCFYMGTIGNEDLRLTEEEWKWLNDHEKHEELDGETYENNIKDVIKKMIEREKSPSPKPFKELQLVLGRRSGKTIMASVITVYEAYKLLVLNHGDPHGYYNLPDGDEISIINVALSQEQAGVLFRFIQDRLRDSPFFSHRISDPTADEIRLLTDKDIEQRKKHNTLQKKGSIVLKCGHSNPDSLAGRSVILLLFDEIAFYDESGKVTGTSFYERLWPSLGRFLKYGHAKTVLISSPNTRSGLFWKKFEASQNEETSLSFQLPTWNVNQEITYDLDDMQKARRSNIEGFRVEFGAQWAYGGTMGNFFEPGMVERCIRGDFSAHQKASPKYNYFLHVDPAKKGNNYSAVLVAKERYADRYGKKRVKCILAGAWVWKPLPDLGLQFHLIDKEIIQICQIFRPSLVTYDDYHSVHSLQLLRSHGIPVQQLPYNRNVKMKIYQNLRDLMSYQPDPELILYDDGGNSSLLIQELLGLKYKRNQRGFTLVIDKGGTVKTDDLADCLAGACSSANEGLRMALPEPVVVHSCIV